MLPSENTTSGHSPRKTAFKKFRNSFHLIKAQVGFHQCKWFLLLILLQITFIVFQASKPNNQFQLQQPNNNNNINYDNTQLKQYKFHDQQLHNNNFQDKSITRKTDPKPNKKGNIPDQEPHNNFQIDTNTDNKHSKNQQPQNKNQLHNQQPNNSFQINPIAEHKQNYNQSQDQQPENNFQVNSGTELKLNHNHNQEQEQEQQQQNNFQVNSSTEQEHNHNQSQEQQQQPQNNLQISSSSSTEQEHNKNQLHSEQSNHNFKISSDPQAKDKCESGRIFVYEIPSKFNKDLLENCHDLDPWHSRCNAISNNGLGPKATGLDSVVPKNLLPYWYWTDMYAAEVIYHNRILHYKCRTMDPQNATAFYIPYYGGLALGKILWFTTAKERDRLSEELLDWVKDQPYWARRNGADHFLMLGRLTWAFRRKTDDDWDWGTSFYRMPLMKNVLRLSVEKFPWDDLEVSVPYPTAFHPESESQIRLWQDFVRSRNRSSQSCFVGAVRKKIKNDFREVVFNYCKNETGSCKLLDCSKAHCEEGGSAILESFLDSDFCLQPKGDGYTRRSFFDCMLAGSIPVYFWLGSFRLQYQWHMPLPPEDYSVYIDNKIVRNDTALIKRVLDKYSKEDVKRMREILIDSIPKFLYARSNHGLANSDDAFDIAMDAVLRRFKNQTEQAVLGGNQSKR